MYAAAASGSAVPCQRDALDVAHPFDNRFAKAIALTTVLPNIAVFRIASDGTRCEPLRASKCRPTSEESTWPACALPLRFASSRK